VTSRPDVERDQGDQWAHIDRDHSEDHHQDPTDPAFGATTFGADGSGALKGVTDHGVETKTRSGYLDRGTESLLDVADATTGQADKIPLSGHTPLRPQLFDGVDVSVRGSWGSSLPRRHESQSGLPVGVLLIEPRRLW
jgi:hypothetical protein